ncbi:hypothetical protein ACFO1B_47915 [Dactylosporangium siamense]|uniref:Uncharacterized protein n=1 Tax=Dactylosporangium siamense TaxID=685454 RepID=A0A919UDK8_9ACTN|nr:hypothetical protein [Dactylosporangium siamense]GIG51579.1 hypothetical protein Dsi01nite_096200 [Dactylosporangium siamense]
MSRTDHHTPSWTRATWWHPLHRCAALFTTDYPGPARLAVLPHLPFGPGIRRARRGSAPSTTQCDLPPAPDLRQILASPSQTHCGWRPLHVPGTRFVSGPTREFVLITWTSRQRAQVRDECHLAIQQHRATGTVDVDPSTAHHRHDAHWAM